MKTVNAKLLLVAGLVAVFCLAACVPSATPNPASDSVSELPIRSTISPPTLPMFTLDDTLTAELAASMSLNLLYPTEVVAVQVGDEVHLTWNGSGAWLDHYEVFRKIGPLPARSANPDWQQLGNTQTVADEKEHRWSDWTAEPGNSYIYGVRAVDVYKNRTAISESAPIVTESALIPAGTSTPARHAQSDMTSEREAELLLDDLYPSDVVACWQPAKVGHFRKGEIRGKWRRCWTPLAGGYSVGG